jgi:plasmid stabilization system protein ParE
MAKEIEWTQRSIIDRIQIYEYWLHRNKSSAYSQRLEILFAKTAQLLSDFPQLGVATNRSSLRVKVVANFKIFYLVTEQKVQIVRVLDARQNQDKLK